MKRVVSAFLALILVFSCVAVSYAATFADAANHWANTAIEYMVAKNILNGYEDGSFRPDRTVTRAEFIKMLDETFGLTATTSINYTDVATSDWFYPYVAKAAAQGYLLNYGKSLNPSGALTRQEAAALLARYLELDPDNAADPSVFPDYSSIKSAYRDYVLQATAAGLFQGYAEDGTFRPDTPLTRAQALTILSRAAGSIYKTSTTGTDAGAVAGNAVITQSGVTVTNADIPGRLIISEGAANGTITLSGCTIGELIIRGTADVILSETEVTALNVTSSTSGFTTGISLTNTSSIDTAEFNTPAELDLASRTSVNLLTVGKDAKRSAVTGSGTVKEATILSSGFTADKLPSVYDIATGISASFAGKTYTGNSSEVTNTGFTSKPSTYASSTNCYLTATSSVSGTLYYYYSTSSTVPTKTTFDSFYSAAAEKNSYSISANITRDVNIGETAYVGTYPYIAVMFRDTSRNAYNPVLISNKASTGFFTTPVINTSSSTHQLTYSAVTDGMIYYYYTKDSSTLTISSFQTAYSSSVASLKGELEVESSKSTTSALKSASSVNGYGYIAILLEDVSGTQYQPFLLPASTSYSLGSGGAEAVSCTVTSEGTYLTSTPSTTGTLQYYFTSSNTVPSSAQFDSNYAAAASGLAGSMSVTAGSRLYSRIAAETTAYMYPYIALRITSGTTVYSPVILSATGLTVDINGSGFSAIPTVTISNGYYYLNMTTNSSSTVYYYLTNSTSIANADIFQANYNSATSLQLAKPTGGYLSTNMFGQRSLQTVLAASSNTGYRYMALMVSAGSYTGMANFKPIVVPLPVAAETETNTASTLFSVGPVYNIYNDELHQIEYVPVYSGNLVYFYTDNPENVDISSTVARIIMGDTGNIPMCGMTAVRANTFSYLPVQSSSYPSHVVLVFIDENNNVFDPIILTTEGSSSASMVDSGFYMAPTVERAGTTAPTISYKAATVGTVYYYFTNNTQTPTNYYNFLQVYNSTTMANYRGTFTSTYGAGTATLTTKVSVQNYQYVVLMMQASSGGTGGYRMPVLVRIGSGSSSSMFTNAFSGTPYLQGSSLYFTPTMRGTLYYSFTKTNNVMEWFAPLQQMGELNGGNMTYTTMSNMICQLAGGSSKTVNYYYTPTQQTVQIYSTTTTGYLAVWMVSADGNQMSEPVFVSLAGYSFNGTPMNPGTGSGFGNTTTALLSTPSIAEGYDASGKRTVQILYTPLVNGYIDVFYTTSTVSSLTVEQFQTSFNQTKALNPGLVASTYCMPDNIQTLLVDSNVYAYYKYAWICVKVPNYNNNTYTYYQPVRVQLS